jgi:hypothetical protein
MALPRSVKEMSKLDFLPRHCKSDHFKGFSFIGDHFALPERTVSLDSYFLQRFHDAMQLILCSSKHLMQSHLKKCITGIMLMGMDSLYQIVPLTYLMMT